MMRAPRREGIRWACQILSARKLESWSWELSNFRNWKAGRCARKFEFLENLWYNKSLGVELGARVSLKCMSKFDREVKAGLPRKFEKIQNLWYNISKMGRRERSWFS